MNKTQEEIMQGSHACCGDCIFAEYKDNVQVNCSANILYKIRKHYNVIEAEDGDKKFFVIEGTKCYYKRDEKWKQTHGVTPYAAQAEIRMQYDAIIYVPEIEDDMDRDLIVDSMQSIVRQAILPKSIVICNHSDVPGQDLFQMIQTYLAPLKIKWHVHDMPKELDKDRVIHETIRKCKSLYYMWFDMGERIRPDYVVRVNAQINEYHKKFSILLKDDRVPFLSSTLLFCAVGGEDEKPYIDKIREMDTDGKMIKTFEELCRE